MKLTNCSCSVVVVLLTIFSNVYGQSKHQLHDYYHLSEQKFNEGEYADGLQLTIKALKLAEKQTNCHEIVYANMQVARMHYYLNERTVALKKFLTTEKLIDSCNTDSLRYKVYHNIGSIYSEIQKLDSALYYLKKALAILKNSNKYIELTRTNVVIAGLYIERMENTTEGGKYLGQAEKYAKLSKDSIIIAFTTAKRGSWHNVKKEFKEALVFYEKALGIYQSHQNTNGILNMLRAIADVKAKLKTDDVIESYRNYILLKDSIFSDETAKKIAEYELQYQTEKKGNENKVLQQKLIINQAKIETRNRTIIGLGVSILLIVTFILWRINVLNLRKKHTELKRLNELQKERERISRDLHDNVGGQLSFVLYSLDGINEENAVIRKELTSSINDSVKSVISNLRETIWTINDEEMSINDFTDKLKVYTRNMFRNSSTQVVFTEAIESDVQLKSIVGLNLYRICQEIINNAFKYANANELTVFITSREAIQIEISDNGNGFEPDACSSTGFGLKNIKNRAEEVGIQLIMQTELGKGTMYNLLV